MFTTLSAHDYFEQQYVLRKSLPTFAQDVAEWERLSADEYFSGYGVSVERYGDHPRQTMEIFKAAPGKIGAGLAVFIHGGFWRAMEREQSRFMATPFLKAGMDCIITEYRLMPTFRLEDLVEDTVSALRRIAEIAGPMQLSDRRIIAGHSAGAHLGLYGAMAARSAGIPQGQTSFLFLSGVFDIFPVHETGIGDEIRMPIEEVARWSVYSGADLGGASRAVPYWRRRNGRFQTPEFHRRANAWARQGKQYHHRRRRKSSHAAVQICAERHIVQCSHEQAIDVFSSRKTAGIGAGSFGRLV